MILAILFVLYVAYLTGTSVGATVSDEVKPAKTYISFLQDVLLLVMTALLLTSLGWGISAVIVIVLLIVVRALMPFSKSYAPVSGAIVASSMLGSQELFITISLLAVVLSYLSGAVAQKPQSSWLAQPITAVVAAGLFYII